MKYKYFCFVHKTRLSSIGAPFKMIEGKLYKPLTSIRERNGTQNQLTTNNINTHHSYMLYEYVRTYSTCTMRAYKAKHNFTTTTIYTTIYKVNKHSVMFIFIESQNEDNKVSCSILATE